MEELNALKEEFEALNWKLAGLTDEELAHVVGSLDSTPFDKDSYPIDTLKQQKREYITEGEKTCVKR